MSNTHQQEASSSIGAVIVTYEPNLESFQHLLSLLLPQVNKLVIVENGSSNSLDVVRIADALSSKPGSCQATVILNEVNAGIAIAQNQGIAWVIREGCDLVLLSDQDSIPEPNMVQQLVACLEEETALAASGHAVPVAAVGPVPVDRRGTGTEDVSNALVYSFTKWGPKRRAIPTEDQIKTVPFVLASGSLIPVEVLLKVGPMNESLFIDHVDLAWCLRAITMGYRILVCGDAKLEHSLGEERAMLPWGRTVHLQSTERNYYMVRNTLFLLKAPFMSWQWKAGYVSYLLKYIGFYTLAGFGVHQRWSALGAGLRDGIRGIGGPRR